MSGFKTIINNGMEYSAVSALGTLNAFTTRLGGVSTGALESLNLGENRGDEESNVRENYRRLSAALGIDGGRLVFTRQVHGTEILPVTSDDCRELYSKISYEADGLVTTEKNLPLIIFTADCIPILLHDPINGVIAAVHAGWRGTVADIAGKAIDSMVKLGASPEYIRGAIGPGIGLCCYETGPEVAEAAYGVLGRDAENYIRAIEGDDKFFVDLKGINAALLIRCGLKPENIFISDDCTYCQSQRYWSHRKTGGDRGSQGAIIQM